MKPYQIVVIYAKQAGFFQMLLHAVLLGSSWYFFMLTARTEAAVPFTTNGDKVIYIVTEHNRTFEWPLAAEKNTLKYRLVQGGSFLTSGLLLVLIIYNISKLKVPGERSLFENWGKKTGDTKKQGRGPEVK